jgi:hypothetical protein
MAGDIHASLTQALVGSGAALATARNSLRRLLETDARLWLARTLPYEQAGASALVLFDHLSSLLVLVGAEALHG